MKARPAVPLPQLAVLGAAVLCAHLWLLSVAPRAPVVPPSRTPAFVTRSVSAPAPPPQAAVPSGARPRATVAMPSEQMRTPLAGHRGVDGSPRAIVAVPPVSAPQPRAAELPPAPAPAAPARAQPMLAFAVPASARLQYQVALSVRGEVRIGRSELVWRQDGASYEASLEIAGDAMRARRQRSVGRITTEGLAPLRFSDRNRSEEAAHFQRDRGMVSFSSNRPEAQLLAGAQDRLSVLLQLGAMIGGDPARFPAGTAIAIQTAGTRDAEQGLFIVQGEEELPLPGGTVKATKLTRNPRQEYDQKVELWLAPTMDYVPVRLRLTQPNGDSVDHQWSSTDRN